MADVPCNPPAGCSLLSNTNFEDPILPIPGFTQSPDFLIPCWKTDGSCIEIWSTGFNASGPKLTPTGAPSTPYSGNQFVELNCTEVAPFWQAFTVPTGGATGLIMTFAHAGRISCGGTNTMKVKVVSGTGSAGTIIFQAPGNRPGNIYDANFELDGITLKDVQVWTLHTVNFPFLAAGSYTLVFDSYDVTCAPGDSTVHCACGNFLDAINITLQPPLVTASVAPVTAGGTIDLSASNSTDVVSWEWTDPLGNVIGTTQSISIGPAVFPTDEGVYCCKVTNGFGCEATDCVDVKISQVSCYRVTDCLGLQPPFITNTDLSPYLDKTIRICYLEDSLDSDDCVPVPPTCPHWPKGCYCVTIEQISVGCNSCPLEALIEAEFCDCEECLPKTYFQLLDCCTKEPYKVDDVIYELSFNGFKYITGPYPSDIDHRIITTMVTPTGTITGCFELTIVPFNPKSIYNRWETTVESTVTVAECVDCQVCKQCYTLTDCENPLNTLIVGEDLSAYVGQVIKIEGCEDICWTVGGAIPNCVTESTTVDTTNTTTTVTNSCCWNNVLVLQSATISILINAIPVAVPVGTAAAMQTYLNGLGQGTWTVTDLGSSRFTFCVTGVELYGNMTVTTGQVSKVIVPACTFVTDTVIDFVSTETCVCTDGCTDISTTTTTTVVDTQDSSSCCWVGTIRDATQTVSMIINGVSIPIPFTLPSVDIFAYLNGLGFGTFSGIFTGFTNDPFNLCVAGDETYGDMLFTGPTANGYINYQITPTCSTITNTTTTNSTYITCICSNGNPPVNPCIGCTPSVDIIDTFVTCEECLPQPPPPIPFTLHPRKVKPGYDTPGCDPEYTQKISCTFGEQVYDEMVALRYGVTICCDHDIQKWNIKKQLLDLRAIYDPSLCKNVIPPCPAACPPICPVVPIVCNCYTITHLTDGETTYEYIQCDGTPVTVVLTDIDQVIYVCTQNVPVITIVSNGRERSTIVQTGTDCLLDGDCIPCTIWDCAAPGATDADVKYIDCQGVPQGFLLPAATTTSVCARFVFPIDRGFAMNTGVPCP